MGIDLGIKAISQYESFVRPLSFVKGCPSSLSQSVQSASDAAAFETDPRGERRKLLGKQVNMRIPHLHTESHLAPTPVATRVLYADKTAVLFGEQLFLWRTQFPRCGQTHNIHTMFPKITQRKDTMR